MVILVDSRRNIRVTSRPQLYSSGIVTSFGVVTYFLCCLGHPSRNLNLQVTTKLPAATPIFSFDFNSACRLVSSGFC